MRTLVPTVSLLFCSLTAAAVDAPVQFISRRTNVLGLSNVADPAAVASAALFATTDGGQSWQLIAEVAAPADGKSFPKFPFTVPADGVYGLYSRTVYRSGHREADPRPGTGPLYVLAIDSTPPAFATAEARLIGNANGMARFRAVWSLTEANPLDPAVSIEVLAADGRFLPVGTGSAKGALEIAVPVPAGATSAQLRFSATDRAGNTGHSPTLDLPLTPPQLSGAARDALAQAVKDMPSLAELGVGKNTVAKTPAAATPKPPPAPARTKAPEAAPVNTPPPVDPVPPPAVPAPAVSAPPAIPDAAPSAASEAPPALPPPSAPPVVDGQRAAPATFAYVSGSQADDLLRDARVAARFNRYEDALDFYDRVLSSSRIEDGIHDVVHLLTRLGRPKDLCAVVASVPPEYHDDLVRLAYGRALTRLQRHDQAERVLSGIGSRSQEAREARYLIARCWQAAGRSADANALFTALAKGDDDIASQARAALAGR